MSGIVSDHRDLGILGLADPSVRSLVLEWARGLASIAMIAFFEKVVMMKIRDGRLEKDLKEKA
jgi:hypothetical protein